MTTLTASFRQTVLPLPPPPLQQEGPEVNYGAVFTKRWVVEFILDLAGYDPREDLTAATLVEPACGDGAFLAPIAERVIESCKVHDEPLSRAGGAVRAFDVQEQHVERCRGLVSGSFIEAGCTVAEANRIASAWVIHADFLLAPHEEETADFVVGNPPYIRLEDVVNDRMAAYQQACPTMTGRSDIYVGFFEVGLRLLDKGGRLAFICADRWMRNAYGRRLREFVAQEFSVDAVVEMHDADAFAEEVSAYPAVTVIRKGNQQPPLVSTTTAEFGDQEAREVVRWAGVNTSPGSKGTLGGQTRVARLPKWFETDSSWPTGSPERLSLLRDLENRHYPLETGSTKVGIGVATGADAVFITDEPSAVEEDRLIPLALTSDMTTGTLEWGGNYLINPWEAPRQLVRLDEYSKLKAHFKKHEDRLKSRHVARKRPERWYGTIDPVHTDLTPKPKLLFPDMKMFSHPVLDPGGYYPHHNLYYVTSDDWDLEVLGGLLMSKPAQFFIESYAVRMRGGTLRFQAQYLRRIHIPSPGSLSEEAKASLRGAFRARDAERATALALDAYGIQQVPD